MLVLHSEYTAFCLCAIPVSSCPFSSSLPNQSVILLIYPLISHLVYTSDDNPRQQLVSELQVLFATTCLCFLHRSLHNLLHLLHQRCRSTACCCSCWVDAITFCESNNIRLIFVFLQKNADSHIWDPTIPVCSSCRKEDTEVESSSISTLWEPVRCFPHIL